MLELTETSFAQGIREGPILLMFYTDWCPLCLPIIHILKELEQEEQERFLFARINFDKNPEAAKNHGIFGVPIVLAIKDGTILHGWAGLSDINVYRSIVHEILYGEEPFPAPLEQIAQTAADEAYAIRTEPNSKIDL